MAKLIGRIILAVSLTFYAWTLVNDLSAQAQHKVQLEKIAKFQLHSSLDFVKHAPLYNKELFLGVAGLIACAAFLIFANCKALVFLNLIGVALHAAVLSNPLLETEVTAKQNALIRFLKLVSIMGGLIYLLGEGDCSKTVCATDKKKKKH